MNSLRDMMETTFVAAAFAERNLKNEARECLDGAKADQGQAGVSRANPKVQRPRPSLKA